MFSGLIIIVDLEGVDLVQTRKPYAFYMLISAFGFRA